MSGTNSPVGRQGSGVNNPSRVVGEDNNQPAVVRVLQLRRLRESSELVKNTILIVLVLITTVCFQALVNPPTPIWGDGRLNQRPGLSKRFQHKSTKHLTDALGMIFLLGNTWAFYAAVVLIRFMLIKFPFERLMVAILWTWSAIYFVVLLALTPVTPVDLIMTGVSLFGPLLLYIVLDNQPAILDDPSQENRQPVQERVVDYSSNVGAGLRSVM
ncbi:hypothetical protein OROMI_022814 [Orobanche minor]